MSNDQPNLRAAAIMEAARAAGAFDPSDVANLAANEAGLTPAEIVTAAKAAKPHWFKGPDARAMPSGEYQAAKTQAIRNAGRR